jgi:hypothetical protein
MSCAVSTIGVARKQGVDLRLGSWREVVLGDERDNLMPVVALGHRRARRERKRKRCRRYPFHRVPLHWRSALSMHARIQPLMTIAANFAIASLHARDCPGDDRARDASRWASWTLGPP